MYSRSYTKLKVQILIFADNEVYNTMILAYLEVNKLLCTVKLLELAQNSQIAY